MTPSEIQSCEYVVKSIQSGMCPKCQYVGFKHEFTDGVAYTCPKCKLCVTWVEQRAVKILIANEVRLPEGYFKEFERCRDKLREISLTGKIQ